VSSSETSRNMFAYCFSSPVTTQNVEIWVSASDGQRKLQTIYVPCSQMTHHIVCFHPW